MLTDGHQLLQFDGSAAQHLAITFNGQSTAAIIASLYSSVLIGLSKSCCRWTTITESAATKVFRKPALASWKHERVTTLLKNLHWLRVPQSRRPKVAHLTFSVCATQVPSLLNFVARVTFRFAVLQFAFSSELTVPWTL
jgi:hypothetical protein